MFTLLIACYDVNAASDAEVSVKTGDWSARLSDRKPCSRYRAL